MNPVSNDIILKQLRWRYAVKNFDPARKVSAEDWRTLEEALVLTPSSFGLQPWKFIVVTHQGVKDRLVAASWNQRQVADASHVVVFAIRRNLAVADIDRYIKRIAKVRGTPEKSLDGYRQLMVNWLNEPKPGFDINHWAALQAYIALGNFMTTAAMMGIDTCPMEGIEPPKYDEILGLAKDGYGTIVVATAGYRTADDKYAIQPKVRFEPHDVIMHVS